MARFEVKILGCGSATPTLRHQPSCQVLDIRDTLYMVDCGEGTQLQARKMRIKFSRLRHIFISHLHGDHCLGLVGLLSTLSLHGNAGRITIHTFQEGAEMFQRMLDFFCHNLSVEIDFNIIKPERAIILENDAITVETVPLNHRVPTVGFIFREKPKPRHLRGDMMEYHQVPIHLRQAIKQGADFVKEDGTVIPNSWLTTDPDPSVAYAYISDTTYYPPIVDAIRGVDLLYHEATYADDSTEKAHQRFHSTAREAARIARDAEVKGLLLGHFSKSYLSEDQHLSQALEEFSPVTIANEGLTLPLL